MIKRLLMFLSMVFVTALFVRADVFANESMWILQPNRTYTFTGLNPGLISHVDIAGGGRFGFVEKNSDGEIVRFGFSDRRVTVSGTGSVAITPTVPTQFSFDSGRLRLNISEGSVITQNDVSTGQTISINNSGNIDVHIRVSQIRGHYCVYH